MSPTARAEDQDGESTSLVTVSDLSGSTNQTQTLPEATTAVAPEGTVEGETDADHPETVPSWWKPSPAGCRGSTGYPHKSHRGGNMVSVHAVTKCGLTVERAEVVTAVFRDRWWGAQNFLWVYNHFLREKKTSSPTMMHNIKPKTIK